MVRQISGSHHNDKKKSESVQAGRTASSDYGRSGRIAQTNYRQEVDGETPLSKKGYNGAVEDA